jgi:hypothetical protein
MHSVEKNIVMTKINEMNKYTLFELLHEHWTGSEILVELSEP